MALSLLLSPLATLFRGPRMRSAIFLAGAGAVQAFGGALVLQSADPNHTTPQNNWRWLDAANNPYSAAFRSEFSYDQAVVTVSFPSPAPVLHIHLTAARLKPFFAYQVKIEGAPGTDSGERIGFTGRWWREEWNGEEWANGWNLNNKGDGQSPNPNDNAYLAEKDEPDATSPTGLHYRFTPYLLFGYFITDAQGSADVDFIANNSYHVLWKTSQRAHTEQDGPVESATVTPDPAVSPAYDVSAPEADVGIFGEWERLPPGEVRLPPGDYDCRLLITEESFHGSGGTYAGFWATAMTGALHFDIGLPPTIVTEPADTVAYSGNRVVFEIGVSGDSAPAPSFQWTRNGVDIPGANSAELVLDPVAADEAGAYACRVSNVCGAAVSRTAWLAVIDSDSDGDGLDDAWEIRFFGDLSPTPDADPDGDGYSNRQEFLRGMDPDKCRVVLHPGWNDISIARLPEDNRIDAVLGSASDLIAGPAWVWEQDHYEPVTCFLPLRGHWLYCTAKQDTTVDLVVDSAESR